MASDTQSKPINGEIRNKILTFLMIFFILVVIINIPNQFYISPKVSVKGEFGQPTINGTTTVHWYIDSGDIVNRSNEKFSTLNITLNNSGIMNWKNITAEVNDDILVKSNAIFNLTDCRLNLTGNLTIHGMLNLINSTILVNCSTMGEFYISVEKGSTSDGGTLKIHHGSNITGTNNTSRIRVLWIDEWSNFYVENSSFGYIGWSPNFNGILIESNYAILRNSTFAHCYPAVTFNKCYGANIENCKFQNSQFGINLSHSDENIIRNCTFSNNIYGLYFEHSSLNLISGSKVINNNATGIYMISGSNNNTIEKTIIDNNNAIGISFRNLSHENIISLCTIQQNNGTGILFYNLSSENLISLCTILQNNGTGILCNNMSNDILILNSTLDNNYQGVSCENNSKGTRIINCSILNSKSVDLKVAQSSELSTLNTSFKRNNVMVDVNSNLSVQWFLHIRTIDSANISISNVSITILDNQNGSFELNTSTNDQGWVDWIICTDFYETTNSRIYLTPYSILAQKEGYNTNTTLIFVNSSLVLILR